jgi:hypothetical protein
VFITQEPLKSGAESLTDLATNISTLLSAIAADSNLQLSAEVQIDCDWTAATRDNYFALLKKLKQQPFFQKKTLSTTIRLHQVKFVSQTDVPPADKGLLMLQHGQSASSANDQFHY